MRQVNMTTTCRKDLRRLKRSAQHNLSLFETVVSFLAEDRPLAPHHHDHPLRHNWSGYRECHIRPDWLLIYRLIPGELILVRTGSHAELFG